MHANDYRRGETMGNEYKQKIAENIAALLKEKGYSQQDLADALGVNKSTVSAWVSGKKTPRMDKVEDMAAIFHCTITDVLGYTQPEETDEFRDRMKAEYGVLFDLIDKASDYQRELVEDLLRAFIAKDEE